MKDGREEKYGSRVGIDQLSSDYVEGGDQPVRMETSMSGDDKEGIRKVMRDEIYGCLYGKVPIGQMPIWLGAYSYIFPFSWVPI